MKFSDFIFISVIGLALLFTSMVIISVAQDVYYGKTMQRMFYEGVE